MNIEFTRYYLTAEEISYVISQMVEKETEFEREIVKIGIVAQLLVEEFSEGDYESCNDIYNKLVEKNALNDFYNIVNYCTIDKMVTRELSTANIIKKFLEELNIKIDEYSKNLDTENMTNLIEQFKQLSEKKEVE